MNEECLEVKVPVNCMKNDVSVRSLEEEGLGIEIPAKGFLLIPPPYLKDKPPWALGTCPCCP